MTRTSRLLGLICLLIGISMHLNAQDLKWIEIDNFETEDLVGWTIADTRNDTDPRVEKPQVTEIRKEKGTNNQYLIKKPAAEGIVGNRKALSFYELPVPIEVGEVFTLYLRFQVEYFPNNHAFGLSNLEPEDIKVHDYDALEPSIRITDKYESNGYKNDGTLMVRKENGYQKILNVDKDRFARPLEVGVWYELWYVVDNRMASEGGQKYDVYLKGGDEFQIQAKVSENADFRMKRELPLKFFMANCNTGPADKPYGNGGLFYDDLYMAKGKLLTIPE